MTIFNRQPTKLSEIVGWRLFRVAQSLNGDLEGERCLNHPDHREEDFLAAVRRHT